VMHQGVIVEQGKTSEVMDNPKEAYTKQLLNAVLELDAPYSESV
jgi:ABC-type oligopeptide transport system ATPase subunit